MKFISAKILDPTHLELRQPLDPAPDEVINISLHSDTGEEMDVWHHSAKEHLLDAYADEDTFYDVA